jgi:hypothetical protein
VARDLGDVLHYFFNEESPEMRRGLEPGLPLPVIAAPLGDQDVIRAAFVWNLAVEIARTGARSYVVAPAGGDTEGLWPDPGRGPLGTELVLTFAEGGADLSRCSAGEAAREGGIVFVRVPPHFLPKATEAAELFRWTLLFSSPDPREMSETYTVAKRLLNACPGVRVGVTIHGARRVAEARRAFDRLNEACQRETGTSLTSYGLLVGDLHVYRAIVSRRPVGVTHPRAVATRALQDVARLLMLDAREKLDA